MATSALLSTVVMGGLLLVIFAVVLKVRDWEHPRASPVSSDSGIAHAANGPIGWSIAFFLVAFGVMGLAMLYASGASVAGFDQGAVGLFLLVVLGAVFVGGSLFAVYAAARSRGLNSAQAAGFISAVFATLALVAIVAQLFMNGG